MARTRAIGGVALAALAACTCRSLPEQTDRIDGAERLTFPVGDENNQNACVSPDGTFLVFTRFENGYNRGPAHLMRLALVPGAVPVALTSGEWDDVNVPYGCSDVWIIDTPSAARP